MTKPLSSLRKLTQKNNALSMLAVHICVLQSDWPIFIKTVNDINSSLVSCNPSISHKSKIYRIDAYALMVLHVF